MHHFVWWNKTLDFAFPASQHFFSFCTDIIDDHKLCGFHLLCCLYVCVYVCNILFLAGTGICLYHFQWNSLINLYAYVCG